MSFSPVPRSMLRIDLPLCPGSITIIGPGAEDLGVLAVADGAVRVGDGVVGRVVEFAGDASAAALGVGVPLDVAARGWTRDECGLREPHDPTVVTSATRPAAIASRPRRVVPT
jgi:hypothetical protein